MPKTVARYGSWVSSITSSLLTSSGVGLGNASISNGQVYWLEGRPLESGRVALVCEGKEVLPATFNVRTRAHEYGGGACTLHDGTAFYTHFADQRLYRQDSGNIPRPITPEPPSPGSWRYADMCITPDGATVLCVRERHEEGREPFNELVLLPADGSREPQIVAQGHDFFSSPRISSDGRRVAWLTWDHPNMPWDGTELWTADFNAVSGFSSAEKVAGGPAESIFQPEWSAENRLHYISDKTGWWNLYAEGAPLCPMDAEFGVPQWVFGLARYGFLSDGRIACLYTTAGQDHLAVLSPATATLRTLALPYTSFGDLATDGLDTIVFVAGSSNTPQHVVKLMAGTGVPTVLKVGMNVTLAPEDLSTPVHIEYPVADRTAHALFYAPKSRDFEGPENERPPLLVMSHGGPTSAASSSLKLSIQYWTNRGFAVADVDYGGSTGYGRKYRELLNGRWGLVDVEDCAAVVDHLAQRGLIDPKRAAIRGGSAGGYTTLCALVFSKTFAAGASHYGVGDLTALAQDTHKFESRYLDRLVGPYPEAEQTYRDRSPIHFADRLSCPVILFQGLDDKVVPPSQAETFVAALKANGLDYEYVPLEGEGHGFRKAESIQRVAQTELRFYARVFGFSLPPER